MLLFCPFSLTYSCIVWANTYMYDTNIKPLYILQKKAIYLITFSNFDAHTSSLFAQLYLLKLQDLIKLQTLYFKHCFVTGNYQRSSIRSLQRPLASATWTLALHAGVPFIFQNFVQTIVNSIFDLLDLNCGMKLTKDSKSSHI